jgi:translation initiation factor IF-2
VVQAEATARRLAEAEHVSIRMHEIIYRLTEILKSAQGYARAGEETVIGHAEVKLLLRITKWQHRRLLCIGWRIEETHISGCFGENVHEGQVNSFISQKTSKSAQEECGIGVRAS